MNDFKCVSCGQSFHGSAELEFSEHKTCPECGGALAPAEGEKKLLVHLGTSTYEVRESDVIKQVRRNYQNKGFVHALQFYQHLRPDDSNEDAKATVTAWCGNLKEGSVLYVSSS